MEVTTYSDFRKNLKQNIDNVYLNDEPLVINRRNGENVIVLSESEYNSLIETEYLTKSVENKKHLAKGKAEIMKGKFEKVDIKNLWK